MPESDLVCLMCAIFTQLKAQEPSRTCNESKEDEEEEFARKRLNGIMECENDQP